MDAIRVDSLTKTFKAKVSSSGFKSSLASLFKPEWRDIEAVKDVSFSVEKGEVVAFLGPNGAGKSTTIKMLTGILFPTSGEMSVLGMKPSRERMRLAMKTGSVFGQKSQLTYHLPARDSLSLLCAIYEIDGKEGKRRIAELSERFALREFLDVPVRKLSLGQRIRCEIAASLLHKPEILFLDEPTIGLDVVVKQEIRKLLGELNRNDGVTIFLTSHDMGDIEKICKRAIVIHHGEIVIDESMKDLKHRALARKLVGVKYTNPTRPEIEGLEPVKRTQDAVKYEVDTARYRIEDVIRNLVAAGGVEDITVEDEPLENLIADVFRSRTKEESRGKTDSLRP